VVTLPFLSCSLSQPTSQTRRAVSSSSLHVLMSTNIPRTLLHLKYSLSASDTGPLSHDTPAVKGNAPGPLLENWRFNRKCTETGLRYGNRIWGITLNSLLQVYRKLPYPIPVALGIRYRTCSVFNNGYGTVPADTSIKQRRDTLSLVQNRVLHRTRLCTGMRKKLAKLWHSARPSSFVEKSTPTCSLLENIPWHPKWTMYDVS